MLTQQHRVSVSVILRQCLSVSFKTLLINIENCHSQILINKNINFGLRISPKEHVSVGGYYVSGYKRNLLVTFVA